MEIIEFKWKIPNNIFKNQDIKSRIIKQIAERTIKTLENKKLPAIGLGST